MHKYGLADIPLCKECNMNVEESVTHFLIECPSLRRHRIKLQRNLEIYGLHRISTDLLLGASNEEEAIKEKINDELANFIYASGRIKDI